MSTTDTKRKYVKSGKYTKRAKAQRLRRALERAAPILQATPMWLVALRAASAWWTIYAPSVNAGAFGVWAQIDLGVWHLRPYQCPNIFSGRTFHWLCFSARSPW